MLKSINTNENKPVIFSDEELEKEVLVVVMVESEGMSEGDQKHHH